MIFAVNVKHSQEITQAFCANGITCEHLDGETPNTQRQEILDRFRSGQTQIISNCAILTEGFDCPDSSAAVIARPTSSVTLWLQMIGRVLRTAPGKEYATILDMTDNWYRLGRPCDNRKWSLDPVSCDPDTQGARCCPHCHHVFKPMPALIRTKEYFNCQKAEFVIHYEVDCPNCGKSFKWVLEESSATENDGEVVIVWDSDIEFKEVPPEVRPSLLTPVIEAKKRKFRNQEKKLIFYSSTIRSWFLNCQQVNLTELIYATELLDCPPQTFEGSIESLVYKIRNAQEWTDVAQIMSSRPEQVKKVIWSRLSHEEKDRFKTMKVNYEKEMNEIQEWLTEDNLVLVAEYLSACQDIEMISSLCQIYKKPVIQAAIDRISNDKRDQINQWIAQLDKASHKSFEFK